MIVLKLKKKYTGPDNFWAFQLFEKKHSRTIHIKLYVQYPFSIVIVQINSLPTYLHCWCLLFII